MAGSGLALGVELAMSESAISGMAFDRLAGGHTAAYVTYRMLVMWKRRTAAHRRRRSVLGDDSMTSHGVQALVGAVTAATGNTRVADVIAQCHRDNRELTADSLLAGEYADRS